MISRLSQHIGATPRCRIFSVFLLLVLFLFFAGHAHAGNVTLAWNPNAEADLAGYKIHYGTSSRLYTKHIDVGNVTNYIITNLAAGTYYFAATAYNTSGIESTYSSEVSTKIVTATCTYAIFPMSAQFGASGGAGMVQVTATPGCAWTARASSPMMITSGLSGSGDGTVAYSIPTNANASIITVAATIAGQIFTVTQEASSLTIIASAGTGGIISPAGSITVLRGAGKTFTITPYTGFAVAYVLVDGVSVGAVRSYTFPNVIKSHMIRAYFTPTVTMAATDATAAENPLNTGTITVSRTGSTAASLTVYYSGGGTATLNVDRKGLPGSLVIPAGASSAAITITPIDDTLVEGNETVVLTLKADAAYTIGSPASATVTILSDEQ
jgi:hypothetical protein